MPETNIPSEENANKFQEIHNTQIIELEERYVVICKDLTDSLDAAARNLKQTDSDDPHGDAIITVGQSLGDFSTPIRKLLWADSRIEKHDWKTVIAFANASKLAADLQKSGIETFMKVVQDRLWEIETSELEIVSTRKPSVLKLFGILLIMALIVGMLTELPPIDNPIIGVLLGVPLMGLTIGPPIRYIYMYYRWERLEARAERALSGKISWDELRKMGLGSAEVDRVKRFYILKSSAEKLRGGVAELNEFSKYARSLQAKTGSKANKALPGIAKYAASAAAGGLISGVIAMFLGDNGALAESGDGEAVDEMTSSLMRLSAWSSLMDSYRDHYAPGGTDPFKGISY